MYIYIYYIYIYVIYTYISFFIYTYIIYLCCTVHNGENTNKNDITIPN